jgi:EmrB/QacA subfamily drug resistance transporter
MDRKWWTLLAVCLGTFMLLLDVTIVNVALPAVQDSLHASFSDLQWVVDAYALTLAALLLTAGSLADLYGRRLLFAIGLSIFTVGSLLCGLARSPLMLVLSRSGQGIGGAIVFATSLALLAQAFQGRERGVAFGIWGSITGIAVSIGPVLGGVITSGLTWRWIFFVNVPVGVVAVFVTLTKIDEAREPRARRPDWTGFVTFTGCLTLLVYGLIRANERSWTETGVLLCFAASAVLLVVFIAAERLGRNPMFDLDLFRNPTFAGGSIAAFGLSASLFALLLYLVLYLQDVAGFSALDTGLRLLVLSGGVFVAAGVSGRLTSHVPIRLLIGPGLILVGIGLVLMSRLSPFAPWTDLIPGFIVSGIGTGMVNPPLASTAVGVVEPARAGMASGINSTFRQVGIATGVAALGSIFASDLTARLSSALASDGALHAAVGSGAALSTRLRSGDTAALFASVPAGLRPSLQTLTVGAFVHSLDRILLIGAVLAIACGVASLALIRSKDFASGSQAHARAQGSGADSGEATPVTAG